MPANKEARERHRAECQEALAWLEHAREGLKDGEPPLAYDHIQLADYLAAFRLPEPQRAAYLAGMLDYYFLGVRPEHFNTNQGFMFAAVERRVKNARLQSINKGKSAQGAKIPLIWNGIEAAKTSELEGGIEAKKDPPQRGTPANIDKKGLDPSANQSQDPSQGNGKNPLAITNNYKGLGAPHKGAAQTTKAIPTATNELATAEATTSADANSAQLWLCNVPLSIKHTLASCPVCGFEAPLFVDGAGRPQMKCSEHGYREPVIPPQYVIEGFGISGRILDHMLKKKDEDTTTRMEL